jgi:hypothetical protein
MKSFLRLPYRLKFIAIKAVLMAPRIKRRLNIDDYKAATVWLNRRRQPAVEDLQASVRIARVAQAAIARIPGSHNCLTRSLTVWWLIGGDQSARVRLGVGAENGGSRLKFHAWVEKDAVVINDAADVGARYSAFSSPTTSAMEFD